MESKNVKFIEMKILWNIYDKLYIKCQIQNRFVVGTGLSGGMGKGRDVGQRVQTFNYKMNKFIISCTLEIQCTAWWV